MKAVGVIPARWASTRLPGKVLVDIGGKPMLQHVWERVKKSGRLADVIVACDELHVVERARGFGANAILTAKNHPSGSDRVAEAAAGTDADIIVNIQSDEPFVRPQLIDKLVEALTQDLVPVVATPVKRVVSEVEFRNPNVVKVVLDNSWNALYFSRAAIPFRRDGRPETWSSYFKHIGIYAYRRKFLFDFCKLPKAFLEQEECLEQLRVLEAGYRIRCVETDAETVGVDTPEDVVRAVNFMKENPGL
ncbi:MAG: 3-deoxy-manno-octulosonate cytidylyltransferase [Candidatus Omnitrophica bacterium]|nr:3-deoxy-manno-octulosonate cytidylyltransferase [Candidatus Omnitrophota bacterium]